MHSSRAELKKFVCVSVRVGFVNELCEWLTIVPFLTFLRIFSVLSVLSYSTKNRKTLGKEIICLRLAHDLTDIIYLDKNLSLPGKH